MSVEVNVVDRIPSQNSSETSVTKPQSPKWLSEDFFPPFLRNYYQDQHLMIKSVVVTPATAKGENFLSEIYRVAVQFSDSERKTHLLNIIIKAALTCDAFGILTSFDVHNKEIDFYKRILPQLNRVLDGSDQLFSDTIGVCETNKAILMTDMCVKGYRLPGGFFNMKAAKIILKKLASFHASSAVLQQEQPNLFEMYRHGTMSRQSDKLNTYYLTQFDAAVEAISLYPEMERYVKKLKHFRCNLVEKGRKTFDADPNHFSALIHGDAWINNILVKCHENEAKSIENLVFVDFQWSCWTSPAMDLQYFLNTSLEEDLRANHIDEMINFYHKHLTDLLKQLNYQKHIPTLQEFHQQYRDKSFYGFVASCLFQPIFLNENNENADFEALILDNERSLAYKKLMYSSAKVHTNLKKLIPFYDRLGVFD